MGLNYQLLLGDTWIFLGKQSIGNFLQILKRTCDHQKIFLKKKKRPTELEERGGESMREKGKKLKRLKRIADFSN